MKGDPKLPGYAAELSDLKAGQIVKVSLGRQKMPKGEKTTEADAEKKPDKPTWTSLGDITARLVKVEGGRRSQRQREEERGADTRR